MAPAAKVLAATYANQQRCCCNIVVMVVASLRRRPSKEIPRKAACRKSIENGRGDDDECAIV